VIISPRPCYLVAVDLPFFFANFFDDAFFFVAFFFDAF